MMKCKYSYILHLVFETALYFSLLSAFTFWKIKILKTNLYYNDKAEAPKCLWKNSGLNPIKFKSSYIIKSLELQYWCTWKFAKLIQIKTNKQNKHNSRQGNHILPSCLPSSHIAPATVTTGQHGHHSTTALAIHEPLSVTQ